MASESRTYVCDKGHTFGVTNWGTPPLGCPRCRAPYRPVTGRRQSVLPVLAFALYGGLLGALIGLGI